MGFAAGFNAGHTAVVNGLRTRHAREQAERDHELRQAQETREQSRFDAEQQQARRVRTAFDEYAGMDRGFVTDNQTGLSDPSANMLNQQGYGEQTGPAAVKAAAGDFDREQARMGLERTFTPTGNVATRAATRSERTAGLQRIAAAKQDLGSLNTLEDKRNQQEEDEIFAAGVKKGFDPELAVWLNQNNNSVTLGDPDQNGVAKLSVVKADGKGYFRELSKAHQAKLSGAVALMERNPTRALELIAQVDKTLAETVAAQNDLTTKVLTTNNDATYKSAAMTNDAARTRNDGARVALERRRVGIAERQANATIARERSLGVENYWDPATNSVVAMERVIGEDGKSTVREMPLRPGLRPVSSLNQRPQRSPYQEELSKAFGAEIQMARTPAQQEQVRAKYRDMGLEGLGEDPVLAALARATGKGGQGAPGGAEVPGRPFYNESNFKLQAIARKPRGVSQEEANAARDELERRRGEARMSAN